MTATVSDGDLQLLLMIRAFEEALLDLFAAGEVSGTTHTCLGQEHIPVALAPLLGDAFVFSNHRGHGHYLARFGDPAPLLAEILGRTGAPCAGVGGSQHVLQDGFVSTGVQGHGVAAAAGVAVSLRRRRPGAVAVAYIGDGTWGEGVVYETLNMASLWRLPLIVVVENNGIAQSTPTAAHLSGSVAARAAAFDIAYQRVDGTDVDAIRGRLAGPIDLVRSGAGPLIAEFRTARLGPHSKGDDARPAADIAAAREGDWLTRLRREIPDRVAVTEARQRAHMERVVSEVRSRPLSDWSPADGR